MKIQAKRRTNDGEIDVVIISISYAGIGVGISEYVTYVKKDGTLGCTSDLKRFTITDPDYIPQK